jgi:poly-beta-1,6-N-acetyl-D-glucosamine synthase
MFLSLIIILLVFISVNIFSAVLVIISLKVKIAPGNEQNISIVVSAKNEEDNISKLLESISAQNYKANNFELVIVDDGSEDGTLNKIRNDNSIQNSLKIIEIKKNESKGKRNALSIGIERSEYPFICITDADCLPQKNWLKSFSEIFKEGFDFVFGIAPFIQEKNLVNKISCYENFRSTILAVFFAKIGLPYTAAARSFGFSRKAFESIEGYKNTFDTISGDDDLLLREAVKHKMKIGIVTGQDAFVLSKSKFKFKEYFKQRSRHTQSSFHYLFKHQVALGLFHLMNLFFLFSPLLVFLNINFIYLFVTKLILDSVTVLILQRKFGYKFSIFEIIYIQIIYEIFLIVHFFNAEFKKVEWK